MSIETHQIRHRQSSSDMVVSRCVNVSDGLGNERIIVHSTTMCGVSLGFHCLWFRQRSNSVIEFKTTAVVSNPSQDICKNDRELDEHPWMTLLSSRSETSVCGLFGHYTTPKDLWLNGDCYNLSMDCDRLDNFKLVAFRCQTGEAYEVTHYTCHGTWREDATMFIYTKEASMQNIATNQTNQKQPECFMLREDSDGNIFLADLGSKQCDRDFDFTENVSIDFTEALFVF
ncbi:hypothetical protein DdX_04292 [Ditylenchus destructor]|uniref:Uncharacterized protein n=1 Tax=Ditylenchus destructor TaxID=166010 RepID=A0AAD4R7M2_9BILA|nr:hypothetical protein DdX_04292 [Ditylenchus destructor]